MTDTPIYTVTASTKTVDHAYGNESTYSAHVRIEGVGYPLSGLFKSPHLFGAVSLHGPDGILARDDVRHLVHDGPVTAVALVALRETFGVEL